MAFTGPAQDRLAIRELYDTYADAGSRADREAWLGCYAEDARWTCHYFDLSGKPAIAAQYDAIMASVIDTTFFIQIGAIAIDGDEARCRLQQAESLLYADGSTYDLIGMYEDRLVKRDGRWWFLERDYLIKREKQPGSGATTPAGDGDAADNS